MFITTKQTGLIPSVCYLSFIAYTLFRLHVSTLNLFSQKLTRTDLITFTIRSLWRSTYQKHKPIHVQYFSNMETTVLIQGHWPYDYRTIIPCDYLCNPWMFTWEPYFMYVTWSNEVTEYSLPTNALTPKEKESTYFNDVTETARMMSNTKILCIILLKAMVSYNDVRYMTSYFLWEVGLNDIAFHPCSSDLAMIVPALVRVMSMVIYISQTFTAASITVSRTFAVMYRIQSVCIPWRPTIY